MSRHTWPLSLSRGEAEVARLGDQLADLADDGRRTPCGDPFRYTWWTSESPVERLDAAQACAGCPVAIACRAVAEAAEVTFGVWAGRDYTRRPRNTTTPTREEPES